MQLSRKLAIGATLLAAVSFSPIMAMAGEHNNTTNTHMAQNPDAKVAKLSKKLDLTDQQKQQIKGIFTKDAKQMQSYMQSMMQNKRDMMKLTHSSDYSVDKAQAIADEQSATMNKLIMLRAAQKNAVWNVLTPEQQQKMQQMVAKHKMKMAD